MYYGMTDQNTGHPTQNRRRRHKSPLSVQSALLLPVPRLADYLDTDTGPSDEEGGKEAKRQKSEPTTPISTCSRPPNKYDGLWESLNWIQGKLKGLRRGLDRNSAMFKKNHRKNLVRNPIQDMFLVLPMGVMAVPRYKHAVLH